MFGWCCEEQQELNEQVFVYKGVNHASSRQLINLSELNSAILKDDNQYHVFAASRYDSFAKKCTQRKEDFVDPDFNVTKQDNIRINGRKIVWKRLKNFEITNDHLFEERAIADIIDLNQTDSYFLASLAALSEQPSNIFEILDGVKTIEQQGIYRLNICVFGKPKQIVIDDFIPVFEDNPSRTAFTRVEQGGLWVIILEKAFAKLRGGYNKIQSGFAHEVFTTFTVAPCLNYAISLNFDVASQQLLWNRLFEARKRRFPVVCGSRKRYTCKGIARNHAYPLEDCLIEQKKKDRVRIIRLANIPTNYNACEHNGQCSFKVQGNSIMLQLTEFMRNFQIIDVAHIRPTFSSYYYAYRSLPKQYTFYTVNIPANASFYLTLQHSSQEKGYLRLFLARTLQNCLTDYQLVSGKWEEIFSDVSLECHNLPQGRYVVCCQSSLKTDCFLRVYSQNHLPFQEIKEDPIKFLEHMFYDYAINHKQDFQSLSKNSNDWFYSKTMFDEIGLAFLILNLHSQSIIKCYVSYKKENLQADGIIVVNKAEKAMNVELKASDIDVLIFQPIEDKINDILDFPPRSLQIKVVI